MLVDAYYSEELKCWVRMTREHDNEWCHTSGYSTRGEALGEPVLARYGVTHQKADPEGHWVNPCDQKSQASNEDGGVT